MAQTLFDLLGDPEAAAFAPPFAKDLRRKPSNIDVLNAGIAGVGDLAYDVAGFPVDMSTALMRALGAQTGQTPFGSDWFKQKATNIGIRPPESADPTLRDVRLGAEMMAGGIDPFATARGIGVVGSKVAKELEPTLFNALDTYAQKAGLQPSILPQEAAQKVMGQTKIVNEAGLPEVYYRGAKSKYDPLSSAGANEASKSGDIGLWMAKSPDLASSYTGSQGLGHVSPAYPDVRNPLVIDAGKNLWSEIPSKAVEDVLGVKLSSPTVTTDQVARIAKDRGFDGVQFKNVIDVKGGRMATEASMQPTDVLVAFNPKAVRSALSDKAIAGAARVPPRPKAPVQQAVQAPTIEAPVSSAGFYSAAEQAALNMTKTKGTGQSLLDELMKAPNVKKDEMEAIGLVDAFQNKKQVTKQELIDYIGKNKVDIKDVVLGGKQDFDAARLSELESEYKALKQHPIDDPSFGEDKYDEMIRLMNIRDQSTTQTLYEAADQATRSAQRAQRQGNMITAEKYFREAELLNTRAEKLDLQGQGMSNPPKFGQYTFPNGENYQETLLTLPNKEPEIPSGYKVSPVDYGDGDVRYFAETPTTRSSAYKTEAEAQAELQRLAVSLKPFRDAQSEFRSGHWDQPNVMAHVRTQDFVDADGKKMRLIEEVQSDWHQAGREKGYLTSASNRKATTATKQDGFWEVRDQNGEFVTNITDYALPDADVEKVLELANARIRENLPDQVGKSQKVPDAPMKETWYQTALRKAVKDAIDAGQDRVGITTSVPQIERYDLSKQVDKVVWNESTGTLGAQRAGGDTGTIKYEKVTKANLADYIGKEAAKKLIEAKDISGWRTIEGDGLQVGGEGMKKYYDEIYPKYLDKFAKKYGSSVKEGKINLNKDLEGFMPRKDMKVETVRYIEITPEMRKAFGGKDKGVPLFQMAPAIPAGAIGAGGLLDQFGERQQ